MKETYRCWAEIDRAALRHNAKVVRDRIGSAEMLAVVKANAYGHGLVGVAETLADEVQLFGVANLQEALTLRESLPHPVVILGPALLGTPGNRRTRFHPDDLRFGGSRGVRSLKADVSQFQDRYWHGANGGCAECCTRGFSTRGENGECFDPQHIDTYAGIQRRRRIHARPTRAIPENRGPNSRRTSWKLQGTRVTKCRHSCFQSADPRHCARWYHALRHFAASGISTPAQTGDDLENANFSCTRRAERQLDQLWPDVYRAEKCALRRYQLDMQMVIRGIFPTVAPTLVRGKALCFLGRVTMDLMVIDVSELDDVQVGDDVVLMGRDGNEEIPCSELAEKAGTISWEIVTRIGVRVDASIFSH